MLDSLHENSIYWILGLSLIALAVTISGALTSLHLPAKERKMRVRKFALTGVAVFFLFVPIFKPFVSSYSSAEWTDEIVAENLNSVEDIAKLDKQQTRTIERLKKDVVELKRDAYRMNLYYSSVIQFLSTIIAFGALGFAFRKKEESDN